MISEARRIFSVFIFNRMKRNTIRNPLVLSATHRFLSPTVCFLWLAWENLPGCHSRATVHAVGGARDLFCFYIQKLSPVFLCFTLRNLRSVISFNWKDDQWNAAHLFCFYIQKNNIQHSHQNSLFTFGEPLLDAESSLENVRDTNITSFLRRFWIQYQNGTTSNKKKVTCLVLQVVFFSKNSPGALRDAFYVELWLDKGMYVWHVCMVCMYGMYVPDRPVYEQPVNEQLVNEQSTHPPPHPPK